jgi:hypothetical protein
MDLAISLITDYFLPSYQDVVERLEEDIKFNQVEKVISTLRKLGNTAPRYKLLKNSKLKQKDFAEVIETLVSSKTISIKTVTGTGGSDGEVFILEDVKLDLKSSFNQNTSFPSFPSFPSFSYDTHNCTSEVKEVKEGKTDIERASKMSFSSEGGEISETSETSEISPNSLLGTVSKTEDIFEKDGNYSTALKSFIKNHYQGQDLNVLEISFDFCSTPAGKKAFTEIGLAQIKADIEKCIKYYEELQNVIKTPEALADLFREEGL